MEFSNILQESRLSDFKTKYTQKLGAENVDKITKEISPKYLEWAGKVLDSINFDENFAKVNEAIKIFDKIYSNLPITDLYQYKNIGQLLSAISEYSNKQRRTVRKVEGGNVVYEDERFFVVNPLTYKSSCYYGKGTKWCTASDTDSQFNKYNIDGKLFYIIDKTLPTNNKLYKVALLKKFDGDKTYYDSIDEIIKGGWIFNTNKLNTILQSIDEYINTEFEEQVKIFQNKEEAEKEKRRQERILIQRELQAERDAADERRLANEWALGPNTPEVGLRAHAVLKFLIETGEIEGKTQEDFAELNRLKAELESTNAEYEREGEGREDLAIKIGELEDELKELNNKIDVYNIIPDGEYYDLTKFKVIDVDLEGNRYTAGTDDEMMESSKKNLEDLIDDIGVEGFNKNFIRDYIDVESVVDDITDYLYNDLHDSPESYFEDDQKMLSPQQNENIEIMEQRINSIKNIIKKLSEQSQGNNDPTITSKIKEFEGMISDIIEEIQFIKDDPQGDYPTELYDEKYLELKRNAENDYEFYMDMFGLETNSYIDNDKLILGIIDSDGYGPTLNSYDGGAEEEYVEGELFYVMRID
jgi:hypothetical protein